MEGRRRNDRNDRGDDLRRPGRGGKGKKDKQLDARQEMKDKDYDRNAPLYDNPSSAYAPVHERRHRMEDGVAKRGERGGGSALEVFERSARQDVRDRRQDYETTSAVRLDRHVQILNRPKVQESQSSRAEADRSDRDRGERGEQREQWERNHRSTDGRSSERERGQSEATSSRPSKGTRTRDGKEAAKKPSGPFSRCRFMDEDLRLCGDQVDPLLLESERDFLVVASLGAQKVGRSTVLSTLLSPFFHENGSSTGHFKVPLGIHSAETFLEGGPSYSGVDLCVTMDRLVLLDAPALFESLPAHPLGDPKSELYLMIFLASICHCILVVTDTAVDPELWSFLRLLATLKSKVPDLGSWLRSKQAFDGEDTNANANTKETVQSLPRLLVVFNNVEETEETEELEDFLKHSEWKAAPWIRCARAPHLPGQSAREMLCSKEAATLGKSLRQQLAEGVPGGFGGLPLTEKQWLHHVLDYWEFIHKRSDVQSYFDLLSSGRLKSFDSPDPKSS